jgi:beta-glucosidase-like glycosyl hydrolase
MTKFYASTSEVISKREKEHKEVVRHLATECMVLLENDGSLPLEKAKGKIALFGNGARWTIKGGTGSGDVNSREIVNIELGFESAGFTVTTKEWLDKYDQLMINAKKTYQERLDIVAKEQGIPPFYVSFMMPFQNPPVQVITAEVIEKSDTEIAIYVLSRTSGEGKDRSFTEGDYQLAEEELEAIRVIANAYDTTIVLLNTGGIVDTTKLKGIQGINAMLLIGQPGNVTGYSVVDALLGKTNPSGRLTDTWAASYKDYPSSDTFSYTNGNLEDEYYAEDIYVGYRYFDSYNLTPNYCFGYGKGYSEFSIQTIDVIADENQVTVSVEVTNIGKLYPGREVVQVYYSAPDGELKKPYQELASFTKTKLLAPGEKERLLISFQTTDMASYSEKAAAWILEAGTYYIRVGQHSRNTKVEAAISLSETVKTCQLKNLFKDHEELKKINFNGITPYSYTSERYEKEIAKKVILNSSKINCETVIYQKERPVYKDKHPDIKITLEDVKNNKYALEELVAQLTVEELAELCVGIERANLSEPVSLIGMASASVPGAAGETTLRLFEDRKIENLILADGPAGLRLYPHFRTSKDGELLPGGEILGEVINPLAVEVPEGAIDYYQYCTAIPIATMLAQSWDLELIEKVGKIVGIEMKEFHIHLWLAPAMNIHRNPLGGRNFEYYSEDPILSGKCAAAITKGVQCYPGQGTTLKHFAANNQEDNRLLNNSHLSERALRELYLKGFEIAVKESKPLAIMTSYNLLNGTHTANHYDLLQSAARDEWGFNGLIMSDWNTSVNVFGDNKYKYPISSSPMCIQAGNDLQMPGAQENVEDIIKAVDKNGGEMDFPITLGDLQYCALNILKVIVQMY